MSRVLVTGANGFVGRSVVPALEKAGYAVHAGVRTRSEAPWLAGMDQRVVGNIGPDTEWGKAVARVDTVVHLAARVHGRRDRRDRGVDGYRRVNFEGTRRLGEAAARAGVRRFVFMSSVKVNGDTTGQHPFRETDRPGPTGPYGLAKWEAERSLIEIASRTPMEVVILRPPQVYGPGVKDTFLKLLGACETGLPLPFANVTSRRSRVAAANLADAVLLCLEHPRAAGETFLIRDDVDVSTSELVQRLARALERPPRLLPVPLPWLRLAARLTGKTATVERLVAPLVVDDRKLRTLLGWKPPVSMDDQLATTAAWFLSEAGATRAGGDSLRVFP